MGSFVGGAIHESISQLSRVGSSNEPGEQTKSTALERVSICWNRKRALAFLVGRIFCGKPVSTFPENALSAHRRLHGLASLHSCLLRLPHSPSTSPPLQA